MSDIEIRRVEGRVGVITVDRAEQNNTFRLETLNGITEAVAELSADDEVRAILFTGRGRHFSTGADFSFLGDVRQKPVLEIQDAIYGSAQGAAKALYNCRKPTVAAISGAAVTLGCELALACDFRIVSDTAFFQETWIRVGLLPPLGGLFLLPRMVGLTLASEMVLQGRRVGGEEAVRIGLANKLVPDAELQARALEMARDLAELPPQAYRLAKHGLHRGLESTMENEWTANAMAQPMLISSDDFKEGLAAVMERRPAAFQGR